MVRIVTGSIPNRLIERAAALPDRPAIVEAGEGDRREITFGELARRVARLAAGMREVGIGPGSRVLIFVPMSIDLYLAMMGALHTGAAVVLVDAWTDRHRLDAVVRVARPNLFIAMPAAHAFRLISPALRSIAHHWIVTGRFLALERFEREDAAPPADVDASVPALITFTTGSTGTPKAVPRSHDLLWAQHLALANHLRLAPDDVDMPTLPVFVLNNLASGITTVLPDFDPARPAEVDPQRIVAQIKEEGVTTTSGSPAFYQHLADWCRENRRTLDVRLWAGGSPVYPRLARALGQLTREGANVVYGSTEAEPIAGISADAMVRAMSREGPEAGLCCGVTVPEISVRIVRVADGPIQLGDGGWQEWELERGATGEIVVTGDHVVGAYLDSPEETALHKIQDGDRTWHRTGDAGRLAEDGTLWLLGRVATRVVRSGFTWWSAPAELKALDFPGVRHASYFGIPDPILGHRAVLCIEAPPGTFGTAPEFVLVGRLEPIPVDVVHILRHIPRDPRHASKTDMPALLRLIGRG
ncbi:MAG: AMP-binding protein [Gemmatimonas sp.]|nr:AMP-binding protein [Gemmatimonas sp.]